MTHTQMKEIHNLAKEMTVEEAKESFKKIQKKIARLEEEGNDADEAAIEYWEVVQMAMFNRINRG